VRRQGVPPPPAGLFNAGSAAAAGREQARQQFQREARVLAQLDHPNLPRVTDYLEAGDALYLVLAPVLGQSLDQVLEEGDDQPLPEEQVVRWMGQAIDVLLYCQARGVYPRTIAPANLMVTPAGKLSLVDFGLVEPVEAEADAAARDAIQALGATMYVLLTGFAPPGPAAQAAGEVLRPVREWTPEVSPELAAVVERAMRAEPGECFASVTELYEALQATPHGRSLTHEQEQCARKLDEQEQQLQKRGVELAQRAQLMEAEQSKLLVQQKQIEEVEQRVTEQGRAVEERARNAAERENQLQGREHLVELRQKRLDEDTRKLEEHEKQFQQRDADMRQRAEQMEAERARWQAQQKQALDERHNRLNDKEREQSVFQNKLEARQRELAAWEKELSGRKSEAQRGAEQIDNGPMAALRQDERATKAKQDPLQEEQNQLQADRAALDRDMKALDTDKAEYEQLKRKLSERQVQLDARGRELANRENELKDRPSKTALQNVFTRLQEGRTALYREMQAAKAHEGNLEQRRLELNERQVKLNATKRILADREKELNGRRAQPPVIGASSSGELPHEWAAAFDSQRGKISDHGRMYTRSGKIVECTLVVRHTTGKSNIVSVEAWAKGSEGQAGFLLISDASAPRNAQPGARVVQVTGVGQEIDVTLGNEVIKLVIVSYTLVTVPTRAGDIPCFSRINIAFRA
jgi:eukaryotic-like serine/threonine-protein kinase